MAYRNSEADIWMESKNRHWSLLVKSSAFVVTTPWFGLFVRNEPWSSFTERRVWLGWKRRKPPIEGDFIFVNNKRLA